MRSTKAARAACLGAFNSVEDRRTAWFERSVKRRDTDVRGARLRQANESPAGSVCGIGRQEDAARSSAAYEVVRNRADQPTAERAQCFLFAVLCQSLVCGSEGRG